MILLLGGSGYIGSAIAAELVRRRIPYSAPTRRELAYGSFGSLLDHLRKTKPEYVIHAAGFTGKPNVDSCETQREETYAGNVGLALSVAQACDVTGTRMGYVSSGCIYTGAKIRESDGSWKNHEDLTEAALQPLLKSRSDAVAGFTEADPPNFTFGRNNCSFYSGTKALAEEVMRSFPEFHVWRIRIPFDEHDHPRNYLTKIQRYPKLYQNWNSVTHRGEFARICIEAWLKKVPGGIYNATHPGYFSTEEAAEAVARKLKPGWKPQFWTDDREFYAQGATTPRSNCILDSGKLARVGLPLRPLRQAVEETLAEWKGAEIREC